MDNNRIKTRLDELIESGRKGELRGALRILKEVDIAEYLGTLDNERVLMVFRLLPKDSSADVFSYMDSDQRARLMEALGDKEAVRLIDEMFVDDAVDLLEELPAGLVRRILMGCDENKRRLINQFLRYPDNSAGSIMTIEFMEVKLGMTVGEAIADIRNMGVEKETIHTLYVIDDVRRLVGTIELRHLLAADDAQTIDGLMDTQTMSVHTLDDREHAADIVRRYDLISVPVVDAESRLVGIITVDDIVDVIEEENTEDFERMAAMLPSEDTYLKTSVLTLSRNRLPWLLFLMFSAIFAGMIITHYENELIGWGALGVTLTASIPMLMDTGGNCGSQSATLVIRGLALGEIGPKDACTILWKEVCVAALVGVILSAVNFARMALISGLGVGVSLVVSISMFLTVILSKAVGAMLPLLAKILRLDPALMASPLITTVVDTCSLMILFSLAMYVLS